MDICHFIRIEGEGFEAMENLHVHLTLLDSIDKIPLRIYTKEPFEENKDKILNWIKSKSNYSEFGNSITVEKINDPKFITSIDYSKSKIGGLIDATIGNDKDGKFFAVALKRIDFTTIQKIKFKNEEYSSEIYLNNHAYDLFYRLIPFDAFQADPRVWQSFLTQSGPLEYGEVKIILDCKEVLTNDGSSYPNLIERLPRIIFEHGKLDYEEFLAYTSILCSTISFFQGHKTEYIKLFFNNEDNVYNSFVPQKKETQKYLTKNLGRFKIEKNLFDFIQELSIELLAKHDFLNQIVNLFNQGISSEGTTEFMLYFTVIEKLRNHFFPPSKRSKEKFTFKNKKQINNLIREKLDEIREEVIDEQKALWEEAKEPKLSNLKYLPQKDQFNDFFDLFQIQPNDFDLTWQDVVSMRGKIFHGKYYETDDKELIELNVKLRTITGNLIYKFMTTEFKK